MAQLARYPLRIAAAAGLLLVSFGASLHALGDKSPLAAAVPFKPVLEVEQLMEDQELTLKGLKTAVIDNKWPDAKKYAWLLAELANVNRQHAPDAKYAEYAGEMVTKSMELAGKMKDKDAKAAAAGLADLAQVCSACHKAYRK